MTKCSEHEHTTFDTSNSYKSASVYVCMYVCMCACTHVRLCACVRTCAHVLILCAYYSMTLDETHGRM